MLQKSSTMDVLGVLEHCWKTLGRELTKGSVTIPHLERQKSKWKLSCSIRNHSRLELLKFTSHLTMNCWCATAQLLPQEILSCIPASSYQKSGLDQACDREHRSLSHQIKSPGSEMLWLLSLTKIDWTSPLELLSEITPLIPSKTF